MPEPTKRAHREISALAAKHSLTLKDSKLSDRNVNIQTLYTGGGHLTRLLETVDISFVQAGAHGEWIAILPANELMCLLEVETFQNRK